MSSTAGSVRSRVLGVVVAFALVAVSGCAGGASSGSRDGAASSGRTAGSSGHTAASSGATSRSAVADSAFGYLHERSESIYDGDGAWGATSYGYRMALRDSYWRGEVYGHLAGWDVASATLYRKREREVVQFLLDAQRDGGTGVFGFPDDTANPEFGSIVRELRHRCPDCIRNGWVVSLPGDKVAELYYDHGYALTALARSYQRSRDDALVEPIRRAADWSLDKPSTANVNYLSALSKGLCHAYAVTKDARYLDRAVALHETGILPKLDASGQARDEHNARLEYHGFIVSGLIALRQVLPSGHRLAGPLDRALSASVARMAERDLSESAGYGVTWPGTNLLAWHELAALRPLVADEQAAVDRILALIGGYVARIRSESTPFRVQKALYTYFPAGLFAA